GHVDVGGMMKRKLNATNPPPPVASSSGAVQKRAKGPHDMANDDFNALGVTIANELLAMNPAEVTSQLDTLKDYIRLSNNNGLFGGHINKIRRAVHIGRTSQDYSRFDGYYRRIVKGTDEFYSTASMFHTLQGIGTAALRADQEELLLHAVLFASAFRAPTEDVGYHFTNNGDTAQHPSSVRSLFARNTAPNHADFDIGRRQYILDVAQNNGRGVGRISWGVKAGTKYTLNLFYKSPNRSNTSALRDVTQATRREAEMRRNNIREAYNAIKPNSISTQQSNGSTQLIAPNQPLSPRYNGPLYNNRH
ncbi:MAG: hypothetical protein ACRCYO_14305, partial [Bacteroidia bacterium]